MYPGKNTLDTPLQVGMPLSPRSHQWVVSGSLLSGALRMPYFPSEKGQTKLEHAFALALCSLPSLLNIWVPCWGMEWLSCNYEDTSYVLRMPEKEARSLSPCLDNFFEQLPQSSAGLLVMWEQPPFLVGSLLYKVNITLGNCWLGRPIRAICNYS